MREVLVIVTADPRRSGRALEALRMSVGLALGEHRVRILPVGDAEALRDPEETAYPGWTTGREYLDALSSLGGRLVPPSDEADARSGAEIVIRWSE